MSHRVVVSQLLHKIKEENQSNCTNSLSSEIGLEENKNQMLYNKFYGREFKDIEQQNQAYIQKLEEQSKTMLVKPKIRKFEPEYFSKKIFKFK